jgi:hypothetical protein
MQNSGRVAMSFRAVLLCGAASVALSQPAVADVLAFPGAGLWLSLEGRYAWSFGSRQAWMGQGDAGFATTRFVDVFEDRVESAWGGRFALGYRINPEWDFALAYTGLRGNQRKNDTPFSYVNIQQVLGPYQAFWNQAQVDIRNLLQVADFEVGYNVGLGQGRLRVVAGARFADFQQTTVVTPFFPGFVARDVKRSQFTGAGPRIGAEGEWPVAALGQGRISVIGSIAGSIVIGSSHQRWNSFSINGPTVVADLEQTERQVRAAYNLEASLGGSWEFLLGGRPATIAAGYRFDGWWGINDTRTARAQVTFLAFHGSTRLGSVSGDIFYHGPFVRATLRF